MHRATSRPFVTTALTCGTRRPKRVVRTSRSSRTTTPRTRSGTSCTPSLGIRKLIASQSERRPHVNPIKRLGLFLAGIERKSKTTAETLPKWRLGRPYRPEFRQLTTHEAIKASSSAGIVYACIRLLADTATSAPLHVYARTGDEWDHVPEHPLQQLLDSPNNRLTRRR